MTGSMSSWSFSYSYGPPQLAVQEGGRIVTLSF